MSSNPHRNTGTYFSQRNAGDSSRPIYGGDSGQPSTIDGSTPMNPRENQSSNNYYTSYAEDQTYPNLAASNGPEQPLGGHSNYNLGAVSNRSLVNWVIEKPNNYLYQQHRGQIPVTWNVEKPSYNQSEQLHLNYGQQQQMNMSKMHCRSSSNSYASVAYTNEAFQQSAPLPIPSNNVMQYMPIVIPPPPPPPPIIHQQIQSFSVGKQVDSNPSMQQQPAAASLTHNESGSSSTHQQHKGRKNKISQRNQSRWQSIHTEERKNSPLIEPGEITESVDANVAAISALSALETKWTAPPSGKPLTKRQLKRRRHKQRKTDRLKKGVSANDAVELIGGWVNVSHPEDAIHKAATSGLNSEDKGIDIISDESAFPPLSIAGQDKDVKNKCDADVATYNDMPLDLMSNSQLASYATVLSRVIGGKNQGHHQPFIKSEVLGDEMDISEDENLENNAKKLSENHISPKVQNISSNTSIIDPNNKPQLEDIDIPSVQLDDEKEKYRLRLEELRAKAKLANAKLRLAKKKRALGSEENSSSAPRSESESLAESQNYLEDPRNAGTGFRNPNLPTPDLTALRMLDSLVVDIDLIPERRARVRFADNVYHDSSSDIESDIDVDPSTSVDAAFVSESAIPTATSQKESESLKQKLHLAKLQLEIKKKELALKRKKSSKSSVSEEQSNLTDESARDTISEPDESLENNKKESREDIVINSKTVSSKEEQRSAQLEELKRRQKELQKNNEVANLRNLVQRQREILRVKGLELTDSSAQLQSCITEMKSKQEQLAASERRLEEMNHRKRIMEGMILRATDKLMTARRNLKSKQLQEAKALG